MLSTRTYPRAIVHFDGDSFFASVEQAMDYRLRDKPVVTGGERGAATSVSIEGKRLGLHRGMSLRDMKKICPDLIVANSDYLTYSLYARRMYNIARGFTPDVEEYSIDECFADITGLRRTYRTSYEGIAQMIQARLHSELGITFGVGLGPNKAIAKIASKWNKPAGFTAIPAKQVHTYLQQLPIGNIWGMGFATSLYLQKLGIHTALDFACKDDDWLTLNRISKPYREIWLELRGAFVHPVKSSVNEKIGSILQSRTFTPSSDRATILSRLAKNIEGACVKARSHQVKAKACRFYLKTQEFTYSGKHLTMSIPLDDPREFLRLVETFFDEVFVSGMVYRATGFSLYDVYPNDSVMPDLFGESARVDAHSPLLGVVDTLNKKYGRNTLSLGASMQALSLEKEAGALRAKRSRKRLILRGSELARKSLNIPYLGIAH